MITSSRYDPSTDGCPVNFVIGLVAVHRHVDPIDVPELPYYIDADLINDFLRDPPEHGHLQFEWEEVTIVLNADRHVDAISSVSTDSESPAMLKQ